MNSYDFSKLYPITLGLNRRFREGYERLKQEGYLLDKE